MAAEAGFRREATSPDDRVLTALFLAGLFHLILILGVSFSLPSPRDSGATPTLEVLLVSEALPESLRNDDARYLAQRTQQGAGNLSESGRSRVPTAANAPLDQAGEREGNALSDASSGLEGGAAEALAATTAASRISYAADAREPTETQPDRPQQMLAGKEATLPSSADDQELRLRGTSSRELMVTPSTRQSDVAVYLDAWKRQVERVGTLNFPNEARRRAMSGSPVVEVALAADGRLAEARVRRSSGHAELDQAAIEILRLAAPFEAFPRDLAERYEILRFAYEWQFEGGQLTGSAVRAPATQR